MASNEVEPAEKLELKLEFSAENMSLLSKYLYSCFSRARAIPQSQLHMIDFPREVASVALRYYFVGYVGSSRCIHQPVYQKCRAWI